ncbi:MAG: DUF5011 domain-containing protein [Candidatus Paceibacterota bacterium]|jgi:hypothetical protein
MKKGIMFILVVVLFCSFYSKVSANELCSPAGYSILTINGIFTDEPGAKENRDRLKDHFPPTHNNQKLDFNYLYNPTHLAGVADLVDYVKQGFFDQKSDYDLVEMLNDASQKVTTQKVLLVAHSQGNFYANNFYDKVASQPGGVPAQSIGVYGVATPAGSVSGGGKYLTSDTDKIIAGMVGGTLGRNIMPPNTHILFKNSDDEHGHDFSKVYLQYQGDRIVSDIKASLNKLKENDEQEIGAPCISAPELSATHKIQKVVLAVADPTAIVVRNGIVGTYNASAYIANGVQNIGFAIGNFFHNTGLAIGNTFNNLSANAVAGLPDANNLTTLLPNVLDSTPNNPSQEQNPTIVTEIDTEATPPAESDNTQATSDVSGAEVPPASGENTKKEEIIIPRTPQIPHEDVLLGGGGGVASVTPDPIPVSTPISDSIIPVISLIGANTVDITKDTTYVDAGATALDDVDGDITANIIIVNPVDVAVLGTYVITYDVSDAHHNSATQVTRTVNVVAPLPPPPPVLNNLTVDKDTTLVAGEYNYDNLTITNNAVLTLEGDPQSSNDFKGVKINAKNITIDAGSSISADAKGYGPNQGPGAMADLSGISNPGGSYGGISYANPTGTTYGSAIKPMDLGSGGIAFGGGAIQIVVSDTFSNNGIVSSNGNTASSGGSIYITTQNFAGSGALRANGGVLYAGNYFKSPGGGGRIAVYYHTSAFTGTMEAKGGCGRYDGMTMSCGQDGTVGAFDESVNDLYIDSSWVFQKNDSPFNFNNIYLKNSQVAIDNGAEITAKDIVIDRVSTLILSGGETINADNLNILGNSIVTVIPEKILSFNISNLNIENGSSISVDAKGYVGGPGAPATFGESGASYGGKGGGATAKSAYGSDVAPVDFGSGTESHRGGGAIRLIVNNNLQNNGTISASAIGERVSGGSIYVTTNSISGNGIFQAKGGNSSDPYGSIAGAGGRIAVHYYTSSFSGTTNVLGGVYCYSGCNPAAEAGTVKMIDESIPPPPPPPLDPIPDPVPDNTPPSITSYTINGVADNVTTDPFANPVSFVFTATKNVDWVSVKIEKEDDASIHKYFYPGVDCDGKNICNETWNGLLAGDASAPSGTYKIKVRIRDLVSKVESDFFSPYMLTISPPI